MTRISLSLTLLLAGVLAGCVNQVQPPGSTPAVQMTVMDRPWSYLGAPGQQIQTAHYRIFTTHTDPQFVQRLPLFIETAFTYYQQMIKPTRQPADPMPVYVFGRRDQWDRFTAETTGSAASIYRRIQEGGYVHNGRAVFYDIHHRKTFAVAGHECFHQYIWHYTRHRPPAWLDEGLACYFEGFYWEGDNVRFEPQRNHLRLSALRFGLTEKTLLPIEELLSTHPGNIIGSTPAKVSSYYAQLWALVLFLKTDPGYQTRFNALLADIGAQRMLELAGGEGYKGTNADFGPAVFRAYISRDLATFRAHFHAYCVRLAGF